LVGAVKTFSNYPDYVKAYNTLLSGEWAKTYFLNKTAKQKQVLCCEGDLVMLG